MIGRIWFHMPWLDPASQQKLRSFQKVHRAFTLHDITGYRAGDAEKVVKRHFSLACMLLSRQLLQNQLATNKANGGKQCESDS